MLHIYDNIAALNVLGGLIKKPSIFIDDEYQIAEQDFTERLHLIIFGTINNLFHSGAKSITPVEIDVALRDFPTQYAVYEANKGIKFVEEILRFSELDNFDHYYDLLKKYTCLRILHSYGFNIKDYYDDKIVDPKKEEIVKKRLQESSVADIIDSIDKSWVDVKSQVYYDKDIEESIKCSGIRDTYANLKATPIIGISSNDSIITTITMGLRTKALYIDSAPTGGFKTRRAVANAIRAGIPWYFNLESKKWEKQGYQESSLVITTEIPVEEIHTMIVPYLTGIPENKFIYNELTKEEEERAEQALTYAEEGNFHIIHLPNFTPSQIEQTIKKFNLLYGTKYFFFDYIFTSIDMMAEISSKTKGISIPENKVLLMFADTLKQTASKSDVHISASTQVSDNWRDAKNPDNTLIAYSKSISDKADIASITLPTTEEELVAIQNYTSKVNGFYVTPNICTHIYKVRRGKWNKIKVFSYFDGGTCRTTELFATDRDNVFLDISKTNVVQVFDDEAIDVPKEVIEAHPDLPWEED